MKILFSLLIILACINLHSQNSFVEPAKHYFGINLQPCTDDLVTFAIITINESGKKQVTVLKRNNFIRQMIGFENSLANPEEINILQQADINGPEVFMDFWKLRYSEYPYRGMEGETGWARNKYGPSPEQRQMLKAFGMEFLSDYAYGDNLIKLMKAMLDANWVSEYMSK